LLADHFVAAPDRWRQLPLPAWNSAAHRFVSTIATSYVERPKLGLDPTAPRGRP
jgi:hypothetical protein